MENDGKIIGREEEIRLLRRAYESRESEFVAIYGRRRIGKTFLVRNVFENRFTFQYTGVYNIIFYFQFVRMAHGILYSWHVRKTDDHPGVQIDLLIDRADGIVNVCEMKYSHSGYRLTSSELKKIHTKVSVLSMYLPPNRYAQPVLITSNEVMRNANSDEIPLKVSGEQLFLP